METHCVKYGIKDFFEAEEPHHRLLEVTLDLGFQPGACITLADHLAAMMEAPFLQGATRLLLGDPEQFVQEGILFQDEMEACAANDEVCGLRRILARCLEQMDMPTCRLELRDAVSTGSQAEAGVTVFVCEFWLALLGGELPIGGQISFVVSCRGETVEGIRTAIVEAASLGGFIEAH